MRLQVQQREVLAWTLRGGSSSSSAVHTAAEAAGGVTSAGVATEETEAAAAATASVAAGALATTAHGSLTSGGAADAAATGEVTTVGSLTAGGGTGFGASATGFGDAASVVFTLLHDSLKHLLHMFPVDGLPKNPHPLVHWIGAIWSVVSLVGADPSALALLAFAQ